MLKKDEVESLRELLETLRKRIRDYEKDFKASEALTRYALVDPLLRGMGWDTGDPDQVRPEYSFNRPDDGGRADYALFKNDREDGLPSLVVEAKPLGRVGPQGQIPMKGLEKETPPGQAMRYCNEDGIRYFAATDGRFWHLFQTNKDGNLSEKKINSFVLTEEWALPDCLSAMALWRYNPNPPGTERVVDGGIPLDGKGYELTRTGKRKQNLRSYPRDAMRRLRSPNRTYFLSRTGLVLTSRGEESKQHRGLHPLYTKQV